MKRSSIDFLIDQLSPYICFPSGDYAGYNTQDVFDRAKEMHKDEILDAYVCGEHQQGFEGEAEQYYNETFNTNEK